MKEQVFRKYDIDPLDGKLSYGELAEAFQKHDVDLSYLDHLNEIEYFDDTKGGVMLSDVMNSNTRPAHCTLVDANSDVFIHETSYPNLETGKRECELNKEKVKIGWDFQSNKAPNQTSDMVCIYADGLFYKKLKHPEAINVTNIVDERPSSGVGSSAITFREHLHLNMVSKIQLQEEKREYSFQNPGASMYCGEALNVCGLLEFTLSPQNQQGMNSSSIMTWFKFQGHGDLYARLLQLVEHITNVTFASSRMVVSAREFLDRTDELAKFQNVQTMRRHSIMLRWF